MIVQKVVNHVDPVTHPLVGNTAGKVAVKTKLKVGSRVKWTIRFRQQPPGPVSILFLYLLHFRPASPTWAMKVPNDLGFADRSQHTSRYPFLCGHLVGLATVLRSDLDDELAGSDGVASRLCVLEHIRHRLLAICVFSGF